MKLDQIDDINSQFGVLNKITKTGEIKRGLDFTLNFGGPNAVFSMLAEA